MTKGEWLNECSGRCGAAATGLALLALLMIGGCVRGPQFAAPEQRQVIDRKLVEYPQGYLFKTVARGITAGSSIAFVTDEGEYKNALLVAESGQGSGSPRVYGWKQDGTYFSVYPRQGRLPFSNLLPHDKQISGLIGGMVFTQGRIFITHRDATGRGVVSSLGFDGSITTVVADLPAQGDYGMTDIAVHPTSGRLYFGVGAATNSGVVGIDNWEVGWVQKHPEFCDLPNTNLKLLGFKFFTRNPRAGLFGGDDNVETAPFQSFGKNNQLRIAKSDRPSSAIYSVSPGGGDLRVEAQGIRYPRGLAFFAEYAALYATNDGMELRGTRPVKDDPDALLRILPGTWYGWPDYSADLVPIHDPRFLEPTLIVRSGYPELTFLIDHDTSSLSKPEVFREQLLFGTFPSLSGAAKLDFVQTNSPFRDFHDSVIVALSGDRAPFATSGQRLKMPVGYKVVRVDTLKKTVEDFIYNTERKPASQIRLPRGAEALERPIDVKFGPDGKLYILDYGKMEMRGGREKITEGSGRIFVLEPIETPMAEPTTRPQ